MSRRVKLRAYLLALLACAGCKADGTYLVLALSSATAMTVRHVGVELTHEGKHATADFALDSAVELPPEQQLSLTLADNPTGPIDVSVRADDGAGHVATATGQVTIAGKGTTTLALAFGGYVEVPDGSAPVDGSVPDDLTPPPDLSSPQAASFDVTASSTMVKEHEKFNLHIVAKNASGQPETGFVGTVALTSSWGDVTPTAQPVFVAGVSDVQVTLNRETHPGFAGAFISATDGAATGKSQEITVTVDSWHLDGSKIILHRTYSKSGVTVAETQHPGAVIADPAGGYRMVGDTTVYMGVPPGPPSFFTMTSADGMDWVFTAGLLGSGASGKGISNTSILWDGAKYHVTYTGLDASSAATLQGASSTDGTAWTAETPVALTDFMCASSTAFLTGINAYQRIQGGGPWCVSDGTSASFRATGLSPTGAPWAGFVREGSVLKLWAISGGMTYYRTSGDDGKTWVSSSMAEAQSVYAIYFNKERGQIEGFIDMGNYTYYRAFRQ